MSERSIFIAALEQDDPAAQAAYLDQACAGNPALRQRINWGRFRYPVRTDGVTS
jgi:hypothetical protein